VRDLWARLATRAAGGRSESAPPARAARAEAAPVAGAALEVEGARKRFGGVVALDGVSMTAEAGTCHAIVGPNGSGKTTLLNVVGGYYSLDEGRVVIGGEEVAGRPAHAIAALGVGRTFQTPRLLAGLTVLDNVMLGAFTSERATAGEIALTLPRARREDARLRATALDYLDFVGLGSRAGDLAGEVPHGQQRLVEIARALVGRPRLLLLDEPAAGLSMSELDRLDQLIHSIRRLGSTVVIVEHHLDLVASIASRVTVLDRGAVLADDAPQAIFSNEAVLRAYMGDRALAKERVS
jgi:ABC-type branched-subunit amino acid transport system ATPase component